MGRVREGSGQEGKGCVDQIVVADEHADDERTEASPAQPPVNGLPFSCDIGYSDSPTAARASRRLL